MNPLALAVAVTLPLAASCSSTTPAPAADVDATRAWLAEFEEHYGYDTGYMENLLGLSPAAYDRFAAAMGMAEPGAHLTPEQHHVGVISALMADDCGACGQLALKMAVEAGVDRDLLRGLVDAPEGLPTPLRTIHAYATQVVRGGNASTESVTELRAALGDEGFAELAVNVLGCRIYPGLRRAMGAETACPPLTLDF